MFIPETIGTPLSPGATRVMLLGAGELSKELAISLHRLGVEVHSVDRDETAPAQQVAQVAHVLDVNNPERINDLIAAVRPDFIVPEIESVATDVLEAVEAEDVAVVVPSAKATKLCVNRETIRRLADERLGLPTTAYNFVSEREEFDAAIEEIGFPCIAKPTYAGPGARSHVVISSREEVDGAWRSLTAGVAAPRIVVERIVDFDYEVTMLVVRSLDPATRQLATWFCEPVGHHYYSGEHIDCWQPMAMSERALENAHSVAARVATELGGRGVLSVKLFVAGDDVYFSEVYPRPHDTGLVTLCSQRFSQFDLHARAILGLPIDTTLVSPGAASMVTSPVDAESVTFDGLAEALAVPESTLELFGKSPARVGRRMGMTLATAEDCDEALDRAQRCAERIVIEADGPAPASAEAEPAAE